MLIIKMYRVRKRQDTSRFYFYYYLIGAIKQELKVINITISEIKNNAILLDDF
jgi:hypothetical protein